MARLQEIYKQEIVPRLMEKFKYQNVMEAPKVDRSYQYRCGRSNTELQGTGWCSK